MTCPSVTRLWRDQRVRFLVVGAFNTGNSVLVSYAVFFLLTRHLHLDPRIIGEITGVLCTVINITIAFLLYKFIVFNTRGNYLREYLRFYIVYAIPTAAGLLLLPILMTLLRRYFGTRTFYVTQAIITAITVVASYFGHKNVTFRQPLAAGQGFPVIPIESAATFNDAPESRK